MFIYIIHQSFHLLYFYYSVVYTINHYQKLLHLCFYLKHQPSADLMMEDSMVNKNLSPEHSVCNIPIEISRNDTQIWIALKFVELFFLNLLIVLLLFCSC